jgi:hypothetical protein
MTSMDLFSMYTILPAAPRHVSMSTIINKKAPNITEGYDVMYFFIFWCVLLILINDGHSSLPAPIETHTELL